MTRTPLENILTMWTTIILHRLNFGATFGGSGTLTVYQYDIDRHASGMSKDKLERALDKYEKIKKDDDPETSFKQEVYVTDKDDPISADKGYQDFNGNTWDMNDYGHGSWGLRWKYRGR